MDDYLIYINQIATYFRDCEENVKSKIQSKMKNQTFDDVFALQTMLEKCAANTANNQQLKMDLEKHEIPEKLKKIVEILSKTHKHTWNLDVSKQGSYSFFRCIHEEKKWNSAIGKFGIMSYGVLKGILMFGIPILFAAGDVIEISLHAREMGKELTEIVQEIENVYKQTHSLLAYANLL